MADEKPGTESSKRMSSADSGESSGEEEVSPENLEQLGAKDPDLSLDVPQLNIEELDLEVQNLLARVALSAEVADFVKINVGVDVRLDEVRLGIKGVEARALLEVQMEKILETLNRALEAISNNPQILGGSSHQARRNASEETDQTNEKTSAANVTDAARKEAKRLEVDLSNVTGTGSDGRILVKDVQKAAGNRG